MSWLATSLLGLSTTLLIGAAPPETAPAIDVERGLKKCRICHGADLHGKKTVPPIAGLHPKRIQRKLTTEVPKKMRPIARGLSDDEKRAIAAAIGALEKPPKPGKPAPGGGPKRR